MLVAIACLAFLLLGAEAFWVYAHGGFASDGFYYFSALRNFVDGQGAWEGPVFENLLGNHSYLTLYLLSPFVALFRSPAVLLTASLACWLASVLLFHALARELLRDDRAKLAFPLTVGYGLYPTVLHGAFGHYLFQPDLLVPPLFLLFCLGLVRNRWGILALASFLIATTKEEFVVLFPPMAVLAYAWIRGPFRRPGRGVLRALGCFLVGSAIALACFAYFRSQNLYRHVSPPAGLGALFSARNVVGSLRPFALLAPPWVLAGAWISLRREKVIARGYWLTLIAWLPGLLALDVAIYGFPTTPLWHSHVALAPVLGVALLAALGAPPKADPTPRRARGRPVLAAGLAVTLLCSGACRADPIWYAYWILRWPRFRPVYVDELQQIVREVGPRRSAREAILLPDHHEWRFVAERSVVSLPWWNTLVPEAQERILREVKFVLAFNDGLTPAERQLILAHGSRIYSTSHYELFQIRF